MEFPKATVCAGTTVPLPSAAVSTLTWVAVPACATPAGTDDWTFGVRLDGKPIGRHHVSVALDGESRLVRSEADFDVKFLGFTAYRYRHRAVEHWQGNCLTDLETTTDDDGQASSVRGRRDGDVLTVVAGDQSQALPGCIMSFAYWNPAMQTQSKLLNAQTGRVENVEVRHLGSATIDVRGRPIPAQQYRITGPLAPIDVWYTSGGDWVGLDATVKGGHRLSYRLQ